MIRSVSRRQWFGNITAGMTGLLASERLVRGAQAPPSSGALVDPRSAMGRQDQIIPVNTLRTIFVKMHTDVGQLRRLGNGSLIPMRTLTLTLLLFAQAQTYPPPYPRAGTTKLLENDRVVVWDVSWLKQTYPTHRHIYDFAGVSLSAGHSVK
jgi:hypothetical protein